MTKRQKNDLTKFDISDHAKEEIIRKDIPLTHVEKILHAPAFKILEIIMKITYDPALDVLRILFSQAPINESDEEKPGIILDYDTGGNVVGLEILDASKRMENPRAIEYAVVG